MGLKKIIILVIGLLYLSLGTLGILLPVLPTTPFILLSAGCFSVSSPKLSSLLNNNKYFGSYIDNYKHKNGVPKDVKYKAILFLWMGLIISMLITQRLTIIIILFLVGIGVSAHIVLLKTKNKNE